MGRRRLSNLKLAALFLGAGMLLFSCRSSFLETIEAVVSDYSTPVAEISFEDSSGIAPDTEITITYTETMDTSTLLLDGEIGDESDGGSWSTDTNTDDTLTIAPSSAWSTGSGRDLEVICSDLEGYPVTVSVTYGVLDGVVYVRTPGDGGSDNNPGTSDQPKATIHEAVATAELVFDTAEVRVAEGTYLYAAPVTISKEISLYGSFSASNWSVYETDEDWAITGDNISSYPTILKSLYTSTGAYGEQPYLVTFDSADGTPVLSGFEFIGNVGEGSTAILVNSSNPIIKSNNIDGGTGEWSFGIAAAAGSVTLKKNLIDGGDFDSSTGVYTWDTQMTLQDNIIYGGNGAITAGVYCISTLGSISGNLIYGGDGRDSTEGVVAESGSDLEIYNNVIDAGNNSVDTVGVRIKESSPSLRNNTIRGGGASIVSGSMARGIWMYVSSNPVIENNLIFTESGETQIGISQGDSGSPPASLKNNNIFDCPDSLYSNPDGSEDYDTINDLELAKSFASGNIDTSATALGDIFVTPSAPDYDWQLKTTSPVNIRQGGLDGKDLSWGYTDDLKKTARTDLAEGPDNSPTNNNAAGWSMGAYEQDANQP